MGSRKGISREHIVSQDLKEKPRVPLTLAQLQHHFLFLFQESLGHLRFIEKEAAAP